MALKYVNNQTDSICREALKNNFNASFRLVIIKNNSTALILLEAFLQHRKDKSILTEIIKKFSKYEEIVDFYTKHNLWKYVDSNKLNDKLIKYGMTI